MTARNSVNADIRADLADVNANQYKAEVFKVAGRTRQGSSK